MGLWRILEVPDQGLESWSWFGYGHWSLIYPFSKFWLSILILTVQRTSMSFKSWFGALEDTGGFWLEFCTLILIQMWSLVVGTRIFGILALCLDFEGAKNIHVLSVIIWSFGGHWRFLSGVWHHNLDLDMFMGIWYTHVLNFSSSSWFLRCKKHQCPLSPDLGLWRMLKAPDWGLVFWSWFGLSNWSLINT